MQGVILTAAGGVIRPNDDAEVAPPLLWSVAGMTEADEGDPASYTVSYSGGMLAPGQVATITVASADGTADAASDYTALSTVLTFTGGGATSKTVAVSTIDDTDVEGTEDFVVSLAGQSIGTLGTSQVETEIVDDDGPAFAADAVTFDGTNDWLSRDGTLSGVSASRQGWGEVWYRKSSAIATNETFFEIGGGSGGLRLQHHTFGSPAQKIQLLIFGTGGETFTLRSSIAMANDGDWHHLAWYVDTDHSAGSKIGYLIHDGVDVTASRTDASAAFNISWSPGSANVVCLAQSAGPANGKFAGDVFRLIIAPGQNFDISNSGNLAKLRNTSTGKPVDVGTDGSLPAGVSPAVLLALDDGETPADNFAANAGTGGGLTVNGALAVAGSSPTD